MEKLRRVYDWLIGLPQDKLLHVVVASGLTAVLGLFLPFMGQLLVMSAVFVGKETWDKISGEGTPEWGDLCADYVGFIIAVL